jgi:hypothetical protein
MGLTDISPSKITDLYIIIIEVEFRFLIPNIPAFQYSNIPIRIILPSEIPECEPPPGVPR